MSYGFLALAAIAAFPAIADATSVAPMTVQTLADHAGQVFIGDVVSTRSYWADNPRRIETEVVFRNVHYLKGELEGEASDFTLIVPGGTVGQTRMAICCAPKFKVGERRLLFLLPTYKTFPTVGVAQGAFRIAKDEAGIDRIYQHGKIPVIGIDEKGFVKLSGGNNHHTVRHVVESNRIKIKPPAIEGASKAMSCDDFVAQIRPILGKSRKHNLAAPAGKRILVSKTGVSLKASAAWRARANAEAASASTKKPGPRLRAVKPSAKQQIRQRSQTTKSDSDADGGTDR